MAYVSSSFSYPLNFNTYLVAFNLRSPVSTLDKDTKNILIFWFDECEPKDWFKKNEDFDNKIRFKFANLIEQALDNRLDFWASNRQGCLALILLLDQFTRNIFRKDRKSFSGDKKALQLSSKCVEKNYLSVSAPDWCHFMLIPMMHSEDLIVQNQSLPLFKKYTSSQTYDFALKHQRIIKEFGRFPHRNSDLGRISTEEELNFLKTSGSSF